MVMDMAMVKIDHYAFAHDFSDSSSLMYHLPTFETRLLQRASEKSCRDILVWKA